MLVISNGCCPGLVRLKLLLEWGGRDWRKEANSWIRHFSRFNHESDFQKMPFVVNC